MRLVFRNGIIKESGRYTFPATARLLLLWSSREGTENRRPDLTQKYILETIVCAALAKELMYGKIETVAKEFGVSESMMSYIVTNEAAKTKSGDFLPCGDGDLHLGYSKRSRGVVQINKYYHPHIDDRTAHNVNFSLDFLASNLRPYTDRYGNYFPNGNCSMWTTCRNYLKIYTSLAKR